MLAGAFAALLIARSVLVEKSAFEAAAAEMLLAATFAVLGSEAAVPGMLQLSLDQHRSCGRRRQPCNYSHRASHLPAEQPLCFQWHWRHLAAGEGLLVLHLHQRCWQHLEAGEKLLVVHQVGAQQGHRIK